LTSRFLWDYQTANEDWVFDDWAAGATMEPMPNDAVEQGVEMMALAPS
jgi:hypothetical protein